MDTRLQGLLEFLELNTKLLRNCLSGVSQETARRRPNEETSDISFLSCHLVDARDYLATLVGVEERSGLHEALQTVTAVVELGNQPLISDVLTAWSLVSERLIARMQALTAADLDAKIEQRFPIDDPTLLGAIVFLLHHEAYHIGQIALIRKYFGVGAMRYGHRALLSQQ